MNLYKIIILNAEDDFYLRGLISSKQSIKGRIYYYDLRHKAKKKTTIQRFIKKINFLAWYEESLEIQKSNLFDG